MLYYIHTRTNSFGFHITYSLWSGLVPETNEADRLVSDWLRCSITYTHVQTASDFTLRILCDRDSSSVLTCLSVCLESRSLHEWIKSLLTFICSIGEFYSIRITELRANRPIESLVPHLYLFQTSDIFSGFQSQSRQPYSLLAEAYMLHGSWDSPLLINLIKW